MAPVMGAATAYRAGMAHANVWYDNAPRLMGLWFDAIEPGDEQVQAAEEMRDEVLILAKESSAQASEELDRGIKDLAEFAGVQLPEPAPWQQAGPAGQA